MNEDETVDRMQGEADRMEAGVDQLGEQIERAEQKAQVTRELAGERPGGDDDVASGEMQAPKVDREPADDEQAADPGDPLRPVTGADDVS